MSFIVKIPVKPFDEVSRRLARTRTEVGQAVDAGDRPRAVRMMRQLLDELPDHPYNGVHMQTRHLLAYAQGRSKAGGLPPVYYTKHHHPQYETAIDFDFTALVPSKLRARWFGAKEGNKPASELMLEKEGAD